MGHVLEKVLADVYARWCRLSGHDVRFQIGTDEHGIKIQETAKKQGVSPKELVDTNVPLFRDLYERLHVSSDVFIRTTDQKAHWPTVAELWKKLDAAKMLDKRSYTGLYCAGCERFITKKDLVDGKCPDHGVAPQEVTEENYFFLLTKESEWLKKILTDGTYAIVPSFRANETLSLLKEDLHDVSFSRPKTSLSWGVPVPGDPDQTMYVWCDALTNYISGLGYFTDREERQWWEEATVTHVIGKDIARFHALIWPAMLKAAGVKTPDRLLIHGFLTSEGQKMSKSLGNVVSPEDVLKHFNGNPDPLRFYLSHEIPVGNDGDFSWERIDALYDSSLRNQLGNLLNRVLLLLKKDTGSIDINKPYMEPRYGFEMKNSDEIWAKYTKAMNEFDFHEAIQVIFKSVASMNVWINNKKPWELEGRHKVQELSFMCEDLRHVALQLLSFIPSTAQKISKQLGVSYADQMLDRDFTIEKWKQWGADTEWKKIGTPEILFTPVEG